MSENFEWAKPNAIIRVQTYCGKTRSGYIKKVTPSFSPLYQVVYIRYTDQLCNETCCATRHMINATGFSIYTRDQIYVTEVESPLKWLKPGCKVTCNTKQNFQMNGQIIAINGQIGKRTECVVELWYCDNGAKYDFTFSIDDNGRTPDGLQFCPAEEKPVIKSEKLQKQFVSKEALAGISEIVSNHLFEETTCAEHSVYKQRMQENFACILKRRLREWPTCCGEPVGLTVCSTKSTDIEEHTQYAPRLRCAYCKADQKGNG